MNSARRLLRSRALLPVLAAVALLILLGFAVVFPRLTRPGLNPVESILLRVQLALRSDELVRPTGNDNTLICFTVERGDTPNSIADRLNQQGFRVDRELFRTYVRYFGIDDSLQAGVFSLRRTMTIPQIAYKFQDANADTVTFRVWEGWRMEEIAAQLNETPGLTYSGADFLALVGPGTAAGQLGRIAQFRASSGIAPDRSLEGFLFPDTYTIPACGTALDLVTRMLDNFDVRVTPQLRAALNNTGLTLFQAVTLASIVQREALFDDERPIIAGVYLNRYYNSQRPTPDVNIPRTLDADPTVQYALGNSRDASTWWPMITVQDYRGVLHPYNTYLNTGLPPGPISNPGLASINGAIFPQQSPYIYFRACPGGGGRHKFSVTFAEQLRACDP